MLDTPPSTEQATLCLPAAAMVKYLMALHGERTSGRPGVDGQIKFEFWVSLPNRSWSLVRTDPHGLSCLYSYGTLAMGD